MKKQKLRLNCFSPPVMLATFGIELIAAVYVYTRYKSNRLQRLSIITLLSLAVFQFAEYNVCGRYGVSSHTWSQIGYVAIAMLPPLGLHIVYELGKKKADRILVGAYGSGLLFSSLFMFGNIFQSYACGGNYVIFQLKSPIGGLFFGYYYFWLFVTLFVAMRSAKNKKRGVSKNRKTALLHTVIGYALFMVPASLSMLLFPETASALPSVMCGFAVLFALVLTFKVLPYTQKKKQSSRSNCLSRK